MTTAELQVPNPTVEPEAPQSVRCRFELDATVNLSSAQLGGDTCAVCGMGMDVPSWGVPDVTPARIGDAVVVDPDAIAGVRVVELVAHTSCIDHLVTRCVSQGQLWPW